MLILAALGAAFLLATTATGTTFTFDLSAADPMVFFYLVGPRTPDPKGVIPKYEFQTPGGANSVPQTEGWELSYSGVSLPLANITRDTFPAGTPKRTTAYSGAWIWLHFYGTGVSSGTDHTANITMVSTVIGADKRFNPVFRANSTGNSPWDGRWNWAGTVWNHLASTGHFATLEHSVPANTSFFAVYGGTSSWNGDYLVSLDTNLKSQSIMGIGSQYSLWRGQDVVLWAGPLDPASKYNMTLTTTLSDWWVDVSQVRMWSAVNERAVTPETTADSPVASPPNSNTDEKDSSNIGTIVGGAVGGGIAALVVIALLIFFLRRHRSTKPQLLDILDDNDHDDMTEYQPQSVTHSRNIPPAAEAYALLTPYPMAQSTSGNASTSVSGSRPSDGTQSFLTRNKPLPSRPLIVLNQESDAGTVVASVPPSYDPQWSAQQADLVATEALGETEDSSMLGGQVPTGPRTASVTASQAALQPSN